jgi:ribosome-binding factor A
MLHRDRRAAEAIRVEVAKIIVSELADPNLGFVTVVGVKMTGDLKKAIVFVSIIGDEAKQKLTLEHLQGARGHIKSLLSHRISMRYMPDILFEYDTLLAQEQRVAELISELHKEEKEGPGRPGKEEAEED